MKTFINLITSKGFWTENRKRITLSAFVPLIFGVIPGKATLLMFLYMYIGFPALLFSKYASPLIHTKVKISKIAHRTYMPKEFRKIIGTLQTIFVLSAVLSSLLPALYRPFGRLTVLIPYLALHVYCWIKDEPLSIIREWLKRIKFSSRNDTDPFEDRYNGIGGGPKAAFWRRNHR